MSFVVTNQRVYKEFDSIIEAKEFSNNSPDFEIYERDLFGNLRKLSDLEIENLIVQERTLNQQLNNEQHNKQGFEQSDQITSQTGGLQAEELEKESIRNMENREGGEDERSERLGGSDKEDKNKNNKNNKIIKFLKLLILIIIIAALSYLVIFIIIPMLLEVMNIMSNPPTISV